jgi:ferrochelatase
VIPITEPREKIGVLLINFGEPREPTLGGVNAYLERIFLQNRDLEGLVDEQAVERAQALAEARAPGLLEDYGRMGGSPLNAQADAQAEELQRELLARGWDVRAYSAFQFTSPSLSSKLSEARADGVEALVVLPVYPICGRSTSVAALEGVARALDQSGWGPRVVGVSGWHDHTAYASFRSDHIRSFVEGRGLDLDDPETLLYFSVHGTPVKYLAEGNRYDRYVEEHCSRIAGLLKADRYTVGFQNHTNRKVEWTQPDNEDRIAQLPERRLVVVPIAFMHEQSETLVELDGELRDFVEGRGKEFHRVPVPHDDPRFATFLADLVTEAFEAAEGADNSLSSCRCHQASGIWCTNGDRDLPPSPYIPSPKADAQ